VHDFSHIERVYAMAERLAEAEGADLEIVRASALLHDADGTAPGSEERLEHHLRSAELAGKVLVEEGWSAERIQAVQHCIRAHRYRDDHEPPATIEAKCLFDADKLDVLGAIGAIRVVVYAALAGTPFFSQPFLNSSWQQAKRFPESCTAPIMSTSLNCEKFKTACTRPPPKPWRLTAAATWMSFHPTPGGSQRRTLNMGQPPSLQEIIALARNAGKIVHEGFLHRHTVDFKSEVDVVTEMDHHSEEYLLEEIRSRFPDDSILSEESGAINGNHDHVWIVDPLDGTVNYAHRLPIYSTRPSAYQVRESSFEMAVVMTLVWT